MTSIAPLLALLAVAAPNDRVAVQGRLSSQAAVVVDGKYSMAFRLFAEPVGGPGLYEKLVLAVEVTDGVYSVVLDALDAVPFSGEGSTWLEVQVGDEPPLPRVELLSVPNAMVAQEALGLSCLGCVTAAMLAEGAVLTGADVQTIIETQGFVTTTELIAQGFVTTAALADMELVTAGELAALDYADQAALQAALAGYVPLSGGTVTGTLTVVGELALGAAVITGSRFASTDVSQQLCDASSLGQVTVDAATKRLYFCDGESFLRLAVCSDLCKTAEQVPCGQPISTDCGDLGLCPGVGTLCAVGAACVAGACLTPGETAASAAASCQAILEALPEAKSGPYWLDPLGDGPAFRTWCEMEAGGGGWTLVSVISSKDGVASMSCDLNWDYKDARWTDASVLNETSFDDDKDHKYQSYSTLAFDELLIHETVAGQIGWKRWNVGAQSSFDTMMSGDCTTLAASPSGSAGTISPDNAVVYSDNLLRNCVSDPVNKDDLSRLFGNSPNNPQGDCINGGWGLGVDGDVPACSWESEARPQTGGWSTQCYPFTGFYSGGEMCGAGCSAHHDAGTFVGRLFVR